MLARLATFLHARGRRVLFVAVICAAIAAAVGGGVSKSLWPYSAKDSATQSVQAGNRFQAAAKRQIDPGAVALVESGNVHTATARQRVDQGYGLVCDTNGVPYADLIVSDANQEHGIITVRPGSGRQLPQLAVDDRVRILPNHACATAAQHDRYHVVRGASERVEAQWPRFGGWQ